MKKILLFGVEAVHDMPGLFSVQVVKQNLERRKWELVFSAGMSQLVGPLSKTLMNEGSSLLKDSTGRIK